MPLWGNIIIKGHQSMTYSCFSAVAVVDWTIL